jgi:hypothetical protein
VYNPNKIPLKKWVVDVEFSMGSDDKRWKGGDGMGIFIVDEVSKDS